jgi:hypothetical protein
MIELNSSLRTLAEIREAATLRKYSFPNPQNAAIPAIPNGKKGNGY